MKIEVCPKCGSNMIDADFMYCFGCDTPRDTTIPNYWKEITVYTDRELKQAQIEAYEDALKIYNHSYPLPMIRGRITALKQSIEE